MSDQIPYAQVFFISFGLITLIFVAGLLIDAVILRHKLFKYNFDGLEAERPIKKSMSFVRVGMTVLKPVAALTVLFFVAMLVTENKELQVKNEVLISAKKEVQ
jgi:hypothetical protein